MVNEKNPTQYTSTSQSNSVPLNATTKNIFLYIKIPNIGHYTTSHAIITVFIPIINIMTLDMSMKNGLGGC